jgi:hypothetical protein
MYHKFFTDRDFDKKIIFNLILKDEKKFCSRKAHGLISEENILFAK